MAFQQDLFDYRTCVIFDTGGMERTATHECEGLEPSSVWDAEHIEGRLLDTWQGRPSRYAARARPRYTDD